MCCSKTIDGIDEGGANILGNTPWTPYFIGMEDTTTYSLQKGVYSLASPICAVNFQLIVNTYETVSGIHSLDIVLPMMSAATNVQYVTFDCIQGDESLGQFTFETIVGVIQPLSLSATLFINFVLHQGDIWQGNFTYNTS